MCKQEFKELQKIIVNKMKCMLIATIWSDLEEVVGNHNDRKHCDNKEATFISSKLKYFTIPHFYIVWKILKNSIVGWLIVAGYDWILTPASIFCGRLLKIILFRNDQWRRNRVRSPDLIVCWHWLASAFAFGQRLSEKRPPATDRKPCTNQTTWSFRYAFDSEWPVTKGWNEVSRFDCVSMCVEVVRGGGAKWCRRAYGPKALCKPNRTGRSVRLWMQMWFLQIV